MGDRPRRPSAPSRQTVDAVLNASTFPDKQELGRKAGTAMALATLADLAYARDKTRRVAASHG